MITELCRVDISRTVNCEFCGSQRSVKAKTAGLAEAQYDELLDFESSTTYDDRQRAALSYAEAIAWRLQTDDAFWDRLHRHFSEAELVELGVASRRPTGSRAGSGCWASTTTSTWPAPTPRWRRAWARPKSATPARTTHTTGQRHGRTGSQGPRWW
jgi:hypothetical protein